MTRALGYLRARSRRARATVVLVAALVVALGLGVWQSLVLLEDLDRRRDQAGESTHDLASPAGAAADALRLIRPALGVGDRFALVFSPDVGRDERGLYRLVSLSYLYPAVVTRDVADADAVIVFGAPSVRVRMEFDELGIVAGVWLGRRSP